MSLENNDSHNNNMAPVKDETADKEVQFTINPPLPQIHNSTGDTKTFHRFGDLASELQLKIFKHALPAPRVVRWEERAPLRYYWPKSDSPYPLFDKWRFLGLESLLQADSVSNASVNLEYVKIKSERGQGKALPF